MLRLRNNPYSSFSKSLIIMKGRPRRKATENEEEDTSSCGSPVKDKENFSPKSNKSRQSMETQQNQFITLLKDFDQNGNDIFQLIGYV